MANDVVFTVEGKGKNLKKTADDAGNIGKNVDKSNAALDRASTKQNTYNKQEKGIYQTNLSSGKAYSKLAQTIGGGGSSALVGAYATLAANVFALTAAFNALRSAAQFEQLTQGLEAVGDAAGRNLGHLGEKLREVTDNAISAERALKAVAVGTSAGFSATQLEQLTVVAKGASLALGRNMEDAMDRLVRGAAKLEPEILDELGIMVRLDDATSDYAATLGKTASDLTQFERRMAFVNAINEQGIDKFGQIAESVDPVAYDQLAASLDGLLKSLLSVVNIGLRPLIDFMANSTAGLTGGLILFASTITRQMAPALHNIAGNAREAAKQFHEMQGNVRQSIVTTGPLPAIYEKLSGKIKDGSASVAELAEAEKSLSDSMGQRIAKQAKMDEGSDNYKKAQAGIDNITLAQGRLTQVMQGRLGVQARVDAADSLTLAKFGTMQDGWQGLNEAIELNNRDIDLNTDKNDKKAAKSAKWSKAAFKYGGRIKFIGAAFVNAIPFIGIAITAIGLLASAWESFKPKDKLKEAAESALKSFDRLDKINETLLRTVSKTNDELDIMKAKYIALTGVINTVNDVVGEMGTAILKGQTKALDETINKLIHMQGELRKYQETAERETHMGSQGFMVDSEVNTLEIIKRLRGEMDKQRETYGKLNTEAEVASMMDVLEKAILKAQIFSDANEGLGIGIINNLKNITIETGDSVADILTKITKATSGLNSFNDAIQNASMLTGEFVKAQVALTKKATTPYDDMLSSLEAIGDQFKALDTLAPTERSQFIPDPVNAPGFQRLETEAEARSRLAAIIIKEGKLREKLGIETEAELMAYIQSTRERVDIIRKHQGELKTLQRIEKDTARLNKSANIGRKSALLANVRATEAVRQQEELLTQTKINQNKELSSGLQKQLKEAEDKLAKDKENEDLAREVLGISERITENTKANIVLESELSEIQKRQLDDRLKEKQVIVAEKEDLMEMLKITEKRFDIEKKMNSITESRARAALELANLQDPTKRQAGQTGINAAQELNLFAQNQQKRKELIEKEFTLAIKRIDLEFDLMKAKNKLLQMEALLLMERAKVEAKGDLNRIAEAEAAYIDFENASNAYINAMEPVIQDRRDLAKEERAAALDNLKLERERLKVGAARFAREQFSTAAGSRAQGGGTGIAGVDFVAGMRAQNKAYKEATEQREKIRKKAFDTAMANTAAYPEEDRMEIATAAGDSAVEKAGLTEIDFSMTEKIAAMREQMSGFFEQMKTLGPEGELAAMVGEGAMAVSQSISSTFEVFNATGEEAFSKMEKGAAVAATVATTMSAISGIMAQASRARIAAIDQEIAAEKKRDGKSKQSLAKIKAMEAKKEQAKRKAFEQNKKMQMATTVASTAAAIMGAMAAPDNFTMAQKLIMAGIAAAMGVAQLAIISGTSYQGGGSGGLSNAVPTQINMGERNNKVNISGGRANVAGELAYLRGARGSGTSAADFRPAFAGRKYRAAGGAAYVVGEQGPELFVPSVPGRVVSNDDMEAGASAGTVNFTINAIDAAGVEEVLVEQRGNIIGMLRESANEYGTGFLEEVNEDSYTSTTEGSVYGRA